MCLDSSLHIWVLTKVVKDVDKYNNSFISNQPKVKAIR